MKQSVAFLLCFALVAPPQVSASAPSRVSSPMVDVFQIARPSADHLSLEVVSEGVSRLEAMREKLAIVAVVGGYHSGKSFLLNALNGANSGFEIKAGHEATTEGLWIGVTDMVSTVDGSKILLLDTEGFSAAGVAESFDAQVFSIAMLLSSHLVYNSKNVITQAEVEYLETLARRAHLWSLATDVRSDNFPPLKWAVQYFTSDLGSVTPTKWLQTFIGDCIGKKCGDEVGVHSHTPIGSRPLIDGNYTLAKLFNRDVNARVFYPPTTTCQSLSRLDVLPTHSLDPDYLSQIEAFRSEIIDSTVSRETALPGSEGTFGTFGAGLAARLVRLVEAARDGRLPELVWSSQWEGKLITSASSAALNARDAAACVSLRASPPLAPDAFQDALRNARRDAENVFKTHLFHLPRLWRAPMDKLKREMSRREAEDITRHDLVVDEGLRVAADEAISSTLSGIHAIARPSNPEQLRKDINLVVTHANNVFQTTTKPFEKCTISRKRAIRAIRKYRRARDAAIVDAEKENARETSVTLDAAEAAATRAYDLEMTAQTLAASAGHDDTDVQDTVVEVPSTQDTAGLPLRASSLVTTHSAVSVLGLGAFDDALRAASATWTLTTRDGRARRSHVQNVLETRGEDWKRRNAGVAVEAATAARDKALAYAETEMATFALPELRDALRNDTGVLVFRALLTFDATTSGFNDIPECGVERLTLQQALHDVASRVDKRNTQAWVTSLSLVGDAAKEKLQLEKSCLNSVRDARSAADHKVSAWMNVVTACLRDLSPNGLDRRTIAYWLDAFDAVVRNDDANPETHSTFFTKTKSKRKSLDAGALRKAREMCVGALGDVASVFVATDDDLAARRSAMRTFRLAVVSVAAAFAAAFAFVLADVSKRAAKARKIRNRERRLVSRSRSRTPPVMFFQQQDQDYQSLDLTNPLVYAATQALPGVDEDEEESEDVGYTEDDTEDEDDDTENDENDTESDEDNPTNDTIDTGDHDLNENVDDYTISPNPLFGDDDNSDEYVHVPDGDDTFADADATFLRSAQGQGFSEDEPTHISTHISSPTPVEHEAHAHETLTDSQTLHDFLTSSSMSPLDITVGDFQKALVSVHQNNPAAFNFLMRFHGHKDVKKFISADDTRGRGNSAHFLAGFHESVLSFVHERVAFDEATWAETKYVEGVLRKYKQAVSVTVIEPISRRVSEVYRRG